jgi:hypothetical protein
LVQEKTGEEVGRFHTRTARCLAESRRR